MTKQFVSMRVSYYFQNCILCKINLVGNHKISSLYMIDMKVLEFPRNKNSRYW